MLITTRVLSLSYIGTLSAGVAGAEALLNDAVAVFGEPSCSPGITLMVMRRCTGKHQFEPPAGCKSRQDLEAQEKHKEPKSRPAGLQLSPKEEAD